MITGMLAPDAGAMVFMGKTLAGMKPHRIAAMGLSRTYQNLQLFGRMSVLENVMAGAHLQGKTGFLQSLARWPGSAAENKRIERSRSGCWKKWGWRAKPGFMPRRFPSDSSACWK
jgi:branched-chain amino acid transport system ATP-binding protein